MQNLADERYKQLIKEIDNLYILLEQTKGNAQCSPPFCAPLCPPLCSTLCPSNSLIFESSSVFLSDKDQFMFVSLTAGGGAGGVGYINDFYYVGGGGGGAGGAILKRPYKLKKGTIVEMIVGNGGSWDTFPDGEESRVVIKYPDGEVIELSVPPGLHGYPEGSLARSLARSPTPPSINVDGGKGGCGTCNNYVISGNDGIPGMISMPSLPPAIGSPGGGNIFADGGIRNKNGIYGSGGGGSDPQIGINSSGNGGSGIVIIELVDL